MKNLKFLLIMSQSPLKRINSFNPFKKNDGNILIKILETII
jgi:hypothetical protein